MTFDELTSSDLNVIAFMLMLDVRNDLKSDYYNFYSVDNGSVVITRDYFDINYLSGAKMNIERHARIEWGDCFAI